MLFIPTRFYKETVEFLEHELIYFVRVSLREKPHLKVSVVLFLYKLNLL